MKRILLAALLLAAPIFAQQPEKNVARIVMLKYVEPSSVRMLVSMFGVNMNMDERLKAVSLSGPAAAVEAASAAIAKLDAPPKNLELVVYFVVGTDRPSPGAVAVPAEVRDVINQLKSTFTFKEYQMLDTLTLRTRTGSSAETTGILDGRTNPRLSQFSIRNTSVSEDGTIIRIDRMHAGLRIPLVRRDVDTKGAVGAIATATKVDYMNTGIDQDVDVKEGQKVVVGRSSLEGPEKALFLILTAKIIQ